MSVMKMASAKPKTYGHNPHTMRHSSKTLKYLPLPAACDYMQKYAAEVSNVGQYQRWHDSVKPEFLPRNPHKVYKDFSWNDFLGTTNSFEKTLRRKKGMKVSWRPFWEAVRYAQRVAKEHSIHTQKEWEAWYDSGMCASDVPKRPQLEYSEFTGAGWKTWLGKNIEGKLMSQKQNIALFAIHTTTSMPKNILTVHRYPDGMASLREAMVNDPSLSNPLRLYKWEDPLSNQVYQTLAALASDRGNNQWLCSNVHELLFELDNVLEWAVRPKH